MNMREVVSRADVQYCGYGGPPDGLPIGNGRLGGLLWAVTSAVRMQLNHTDVFPFDRATESVLNIFDDYCGGCGAIEIDLNDPGFLVSPDPGRHTVTGRLSLYDGLAVWQGDSTIVNAVVDPDSDLVALRISGPAEVLDRLHIGLKALRPAEVRINKHTAQSVLETDGESLVLRQTFEEKEHYCATAVAVGLAGRAGRTEIVKEQIGRLYPEAGSESITVLAAVATTLDRRDDVAAEARRLLAAGRRQMFEEIQRRTASRWAEFWGKSVVRLHSADGAADDVEQAYTTWLYHMNCCSRGRYPVKFNGLLWNANGDERDWGSQYWWWNMETLYRALDAANHPELMKPLFRLYTGMRESCELGARQQWNSEGVYLPETVPFNGLEPLDENIAGELAAFLREEKKWEDTSAGFRQLAESRHPLSSRWNFMRTNRVNYHRPYSYVVHLFSSGAKIAELYWKHYQYTGDRAFLRDEAYPLIKGVAEFYRHLPLVSMGADGRYHIRQVNNQESFWGATDPQEELCAMRGISFFAAAAARELDVDADLQKVWYEFGSRVAPIATSDEPEAVGFDSHPDGPTWASARRPRMVDEGHGVFNILRPCVHFDLLTLETDDPAVWAIARRSFEVSGQRAVYLKGKRASVLSHTPIEAACLGLPEDVKKILPLQARASGDARNRLNPDEGASAQTVEHLGQTAYALQQALCQSIAAAPGGEPVIHLFPAWPKEWEAEFTLLCRGGFLVSAARRQGRIEDVTIKSQRGGVCRIRHPWPGRPAFLRDRRGEKLLEMDKSLIVFKTAAGSEYTLTPEEEAKIEKKQK